MDSRAPLPSHNTINQMEQPDLRTDENNIIVTAPMAAGIATDIQQQTTTVSSITATASSSPSPMLLSRINTGLDDIPPPKPDYYAPPPYDAAYVVPMRMPNKLPTYEEVQWEKQFEGDLNAPIPLPIPPPPRIAPITQRIIAVDADATEDMDTSLLGTDFMFYIAFFVAFIFNWIGFLLLMCFCHTVASRYGALSGFGLSLAKWTFIVQHSTDLASKDNSWLWWLIMTFGLIICLRAILQYLSIKRTWHLMSSSTQERLLFFY